MQNLSLIKMKANKNIIQMFVAPILFLLTQPASAKVALSPLFSDNMVLQQKDKVALWGKSNADKNVLITTSWNHKKYKAKADANGNWKIKVATPKAGVPKPGETVLQIL